MGYGIIIFAIPFHLSMMSAANKSNQGIRGVPTSDLWDIGRDSGKILIRSHSLIQVLGTRPVLHFKSVTNWLEKLITVTRKRAAYHMSSTVNALLTSNLTCLQKGTKLSSVIHICSYNFHVLRRQVNTNCNFQKTHYLAHS